MKNSILIEPSRLKTSWLLCTNRKDPLLYRAIESCLSQTIKDFELLLIVNGSACIEIVQCLQRQYAEDARVRVVGTPINLLNFSLSLGLHLARGPYVARMDADDVAAPDRLERQWAYMERNPQVAVLGSAYQLIDSTGQIHGQVSPPTSDAEIRRELHYRNPICHPSVMLRRDVILKQGGYLGGQNAEDYDLWLRLAMHTEWQFANLPEKLLSYNVSPDGAARRSRTAYANVAAAQLRNFLITRDPRWLLGSVITAAKSVWRANRA